MKTALFILTLVLAGSQYADANCINPKDYLDSTVSLVRYNAFYDDYKDGGTAWFYKDARTLVTAGHVAMGILLSSEWSSLEIRQRKDLYTISETQPARILQIGNIASASNTEIAFMEKYAKVDLAIIELAFDFHGARPLEISQSKPPHYSPLWAIAYPKNKAVLANGRSIPPGYDKKYLEEYASMLHVNIQNPRLRHGASGAPILNCEGKVAGILNIYIDRVLHLANGKTIKRPASAPTNYAVPASFITELLERK